MLYFVMLMFVVNTSIVRLIYILLGTLYTMIFQEIGFYEVVHLKQILLF